MGIEKLINRLKINKMKKFYLDSSLSAGTMFAQKVLKDAKRLLTVII